MEAPPFDQTATDGDSGSRLTHDHGPIVTRSWPDRGENHGLFEANLKPNPGSFHADREATMSPQGIAPTDQQNRLHDRFNDPRNRAKFLFKTRCNSLFVF